MHKKLYLALLLSGLHCTYMDAPDEIGSIDVSPVHITDSNENNTANNVELTEEQQRERERLLQAEDAAARDRELNKTTQTQTVFNRNRQDNSNRNTSTDLTQDSDQSAANTPDQKQVNDLLRDLSGPPLVKKTKFTQDQTEQLQLARQKVFQTLRDIELPEDLKSFLINEEIFKKIKNNLAKCKTKENFIDLLIKTKYLMESFVSSTKLTMEENIGNNNPTITEFNSFIDASFAEYQATEPKTINSVNKLLKQIEYAKDKAIGSAEIETALSYAREKCPKNKKLLTNLETLKTEWENENFITNLSDTLFNLQKNLNKQLSGFNRFLLRVGIGSLKQQTSILPKSESSTLTDEQKIKLANVAKIHIENTINSIIDKSKKLGLTNGFINLYAIDIYPLEEVKTIIFKQINKLQNQNIHNPEEFKKALNMVISQFNLIKCSVGVDILKKCLEKQKDKIIAFKQFHASSDREDMQDPKRFNFRAYDYNEGRRIELYVKQYNEIDTIFEIWEKYQQDLLENSPDDKTEEFYNNKFEFEDFNLNALFARLKSIQSMRPTA